MVRVSIGSGAYVAGALWLASCGGHALQEGQGAPVGGAGGTPMVSAGAPTVAGAATLAGAPPNAGAGSGDDDPSCRVGSGCVVASGARIAELRANATHLYWLDLGASDPSEGTPGARVYRAPFASGRAMLVANDVFEAASIGVTDSQLLVSDREKLIRYDAVGDARETIPFPDAVSAAWQGWLTSDGTTAYISGAAGLYRLRSDETAVALLIEYAVGSMVVIGNDLYFEGRPLDGSADFTGVYQIPTSGGSVRPVVRGGLHALQRRSNELYGFDCGAPGPDCLWSVPAGSAMPVHVPSAALGSGRAMFAGDFLVQEVERSGLARLSPTQPGLVLWSVANVVRPLGERDDATWVATNGGLYWTDGHMIYRRRDPN